MCLYLPRHDVEGEADEEDLYLVRAEPSGEGEVVLVIDDEPTIRMLISGVLAESGYAVIGAPDGPAGLGVLEFQCENRPVDYRCRLARWPERQVSRGCRPRRAA